MRIWARAGLALSIMVFALPMYEKFEDPKAAAVRVCGLAALAAAAVSWRTLRGVSWTALDAAVLVWLATELIATLCSSAPWLSLFGDARQREGLTTSVAAAGLYLAARIGTREAADAERTLDVALASVALAGAYALLQAAGVDWIAWAPRVVGGSPIAVGRPAATLGHANLLGVLACAGAVLAWTRAAASGRGRAAYATAAALATLATMVTLSRAAGLGLVGGIAVAASLWVASGSPRRPSPRALFAAAAALTLVIVTAIASGRLGMLALRFEEMLRPASGSAGSRIEIWHAALAAWRSRPWLGWGPDTFGMIFPVYQTPGLWRGEWGFVPFHAHSIYLEILTTRGVTGLAAVLAWAVVLVLALARAWRRAPGDRATLAALTGMLAALAVAGAFGALSIAGQALLMVASGLIAARSAPPHTAPPSRGPAVAGAVAAGLAVLWFAADFTASQAQEEAERWLNLLGTAEERAAGAIGARLLETSARAARWAPADDRIARLRSDALLAAADFSPRPAPLLVEATAEARHAIRLAPWRSACHLQLARVLATRVAMGDRASLPASRAARERAQQLAPVHAAYLDECARLDLMTGDVDLAIVRARRATQLYPEDGPSRAMLGRALARGAGAAAGAEELRRSLAGQWHGDISGREEARRDLARLEVAQP